MNREKLLREDDYVAARSDEYVWSQSRKFGISRRGFLRVMAAGGVLAPLAANGVRPPSAHPAAAQPVLKATPPELFNDFGSNKEMRWEAMYGRGYLVPNELFFVRNHTRTPTVDVNSWRLKIDGSGVSRSLELTYDDVLAMPAVSFVRYVECAGNGRSFFEGAHGKKAQGTQWKLGAIGVAEWTGVPLREILERAGLKKTARDVMPEGLDDLKVRRPMSLDKAMEEDTLLVYAMNGQPLPADHGFPVRVLTPGWIGIANIKWVGRIQVSEEPLFSQWNTDTYVMIGPDYKSSPPAKGPILSAQTVKGALELPWGGEITAGRKLLRGRAWSPQGKIDRVEYSFDQGKNWQKARLREPNIVKAWVRWDADWDARPGKHLVRVRVTDERGGTQPDRVPYNEQGYLFNAMVDHPITVR
ncbi:MAG TPA: sulfite oxidase [Candidatus Binatia bacterium]|nr:sulfite oxidase [Candidatus Binatia bacterium]